MEFLSEKSAMDSNGAMASNGLSFPLDSTASLFGLPGNSNVHLHNHNTRCQTLENWLQLYQKNNSGGELQTDNPSSDGVCHAASSEATSVTTKASSSATNGHLCVKGAPGKGGKKRSRASRKTPTTMLTTDASNFRAMVQQFTGIPEFPFGSVPLSAAATAARQGSLLGRSFPHHLSSVACYNNNNNNSNPILPQQYYSPFPFHSFLSNDDNLRSSNSLFLPRSPGQQATLLDDGGLNSPSATLFSSPAMLSSERRPGYLM